MSATLTILIVGGYGTFGGRIVDLLQATPGLTLIVAGRSMEKARAFCAARTGAAATLKPALFDRDGDVEGRIGSLGPDILIDASGPFQAYGETRYRVIEGCLGARVNYLDLADGSEFVAGVKAFDARAKSAGIYVLSGVSSFPVLTAAVVRRLSQGLSRIDSIRGGIAPSPYAGVGENVIRAIASYAGQSVALKRDGQNALGYPLTEVTRYTISVPGRTPLRNTLFSLVDVPDHVALSELWPEAREIWMGAGPVPEILHRLLIGLSWLVRWRLVPTLAPVAGLMHWATNHLRWGEHRGGMFVEVAGREGALPVRRSWHMLAEGGDGPLIPSMAVEAIIRRRLSGQPSAPGARAAVQDLELADYEALFAGRAISTGVRDEGRPDDGLYRRILGSAYDELPGAVQTLHVAGAAEGEARVERGAGVLAKGVGRIVGFPSATPSIALRVIFDRGGGREVWTRRFGAESFRSDQFAGVGRSDGLLVESFGPLAFAMALVIDGAKLSMKLRRWTAFGVPMPMWMAPGIVASERARDGVFHFEVEIGHPLIGLIVAYRGWLKPDAAG